MIECSIFGYLKEIDCLCNCLRLYRRTDATVHETIYANASKTLMVSEEKNGVYLLSRDAPDKNKNRTALCSNIQRSKVKTPNTLGSFLSAFGFELIRRNKVSIITFKRENINVEISRCISEEDGMHRIELESPSAKLEMDEFYLVKVFTIAESAADGEKVLSKVAEELEEQVQLVKPSVRWSG